MTLAELNEHFELARELAEAKELLENLEAKAGPKSPRIDGLPRAPGASDPVGNLAAEIADLKETITGLTEELSRSETKVTAFIQTITDNRTRLIFRLRFIRGLPWCEVADALGRYATEAGVKSACLRYLKRINAEAAQNAR